MNFTALNFTASNFTLGSNLTLSSNYTALDQAIVNYLGLVNTPEFPLSDFFTLVVATVLFVVTIFSLKGYLKANPGVSVNTKGFSTFHNYFLCLLSFVMFAGGSYHFFFGENAPPSLQLLACTPPGTLYPTEFRFWIYIYYLSKFYEYIDTIILLLNRRPLIFLHVYHHIIVPFMVWMWLRVDSVLTMHGLIINAGVHTLMYYYYGSNNRNYYFKRLITSIQIIQFVLSFIVTYLYFHFHYTTRLGCNQPNASFLSVLINISFLFLFLNFFGSTYNRKAPPRKTNPILPDNPVDTTPDTTIPTAKITTATTIKRT